MITLFFLSSMAMATTPETHDFHVKGEVHYRCYAGKDAKAVDDFTHAVCDSKDYAKVILDKDIKVKITDEPDPSHSTDLAGSWSEKVEFKKRHFEIAISLFKNDSANPYRIRVVANDNEPTSRQTVVYTSMKNLSDMTPLELEHSSMGKKEEIEFTATVALPSPAK